MVAASFIPLLHIGPIGCATAGDFQHFATVNVDDFVVITTKGDQLPLFAFLGRITIPLLNWGTITLTRARQIQTFITMYQLHGIQTFRYALATEPGGQQLEALLWGGAAEVLPELGTFSR